MTFEISVSDDVALVPARRGLRCRFRLPNESFSYWSTVTARRHHVRGGDGPVPDLASLRLHLRSGGKGDRLREAARIEEAVTSAHLRQVPVIGPADLDPDDVDHGAVTAELRSQALLGRGGKLRGRRQARRHAVGAVDEAVSERRLRAASDRDADLVEAERNYAALVANDPAAVLGALEAAFDADDVPATPVACAGGTVSIVVCAPARDAVPGQRVTWPRRGKPVMSERSDAEREQLTVRVLASQSLAAVRRAAASAPSIRSVRILAVRPAPERREAEAVFAGRFDVADGERWSDASVDAVHELAVAPEGLLASTERIHGLDLTGEPDIDRVVKEVTAALYP